MRILFFAILAAIVSLCSPFVHAEDLLILDTTDHYLGGCQLTDTATWTLDKDIAVTTFQVWYSWNSGEVSLPVTLTKDGKTLAEFTATRSSCDPYQKQWCNADYALNSTLTKGTYTATIPNKRMCLKPGATGTVRLYGASQSVSATTAPTAQPTVFPTVAPTGIVVAKPFSQTPCSCNQTGVVATAVGISAVLSFVINFLLRKR